MKGETSDKCNTQVASKQSRLIFTQKRHKLENNHERYRLALKTETTYYYVIYLYLAKDGKIILHSSGTSTTFKAQWLVII